MICLGNQPQIRTKDYDSAVAQLRAYELFKANYMARNPGGIVLSELEYKGATTFAHPRIHSIRVGNQHHNRIFDVLAIDFRNAEKAWGFRKPDGMAINAQGTAGELLEVTTKTNSPKAKVQMNDKIRILNEISRIHDLRIDWAPTRWVPANTERELYYPAQPQANELLRYVCFKPTYGRNERELLGIILYEMHAIERGFRRSIPSSLPQSIQEDLQANYKRKKFKTVSATVWAEGFLATHPSTKPVLQGLALTLSAGILVIVILLALDPIPGDEVAAAYAAMALIRLAR